MAPDETNPEIKSIGTIEQTISCDTDGCTNQQALTTLFPPPDNWDWEAEHAKTGWVVDPTTGLRSCPAHAPKP